MNYTDKELLRSAQVAYYDINENVIINVTNELRSMGITDFSTHYTLKNIYTYSEIFRTSIYESLSATCGFNVTENDDKDIVLSLIEDTAKKVAVSDVYSIIDELQKSEEDCIGSWKLVSYVFNDDIGVKGNAGTLSNGVWNINSEFSTSGDGLCAYVFETSDDSAIVAFRGSQPLNNLDDVTSFDFVSDWLSADGGLAVDDDTPQQKSVYEFIKDYVNNLGYDHYAFAGHSLGGNLAMHAAVSMYEVDNGNLSNISQVVSFDGPGYIDSYMQRHPATEALKENTATQLTHYSWSFVGVLLDQYTDDDWYVKAGFSDASAENGFNNMSDWDYFAAVHGTCYPQYNSDDNCYTHDICTEPMAFFDAITKYITDAPAPFRSSIIDLALLAIKSTNASIELVDAETFIEMCEIIVSLSINDADSGNLFDAIHTPTDLGKAIAEGIANGIINNAYDLLEMTANGKHTISDSHGVNQLLFPCVKDDVVVSLYNDTDIIIEWGENDDYVIIEGYLEEGNDAKYNLIFKDGIAMSQTNSKSPFRALHGTVEDDEMNPLFDYDLPATLYGNIGNDTIYGGRNDDTLYGEYGEDTIYGREGNDTIDGGYCNDKLYGFEGDDTYLFYGSSDADIIYDTEGDNYIKFGEGITPNDTYITISDGGVIKLHIDGYDSTMEVFDFLSDEDARNFTLVYESGAKIKADAENSPFRRVFSSDYDDTYKNIFADGELIVWGTSTADMLKGGSLTDTIKGNGGSDNIVGWDGDDSIYGGDGKDTIYGGNGADIIYGENEDDTIYGEEDDDAIYGGIGNDSIFGGYGKDEINGGDGNDTIYCDVTSDILNGGDDTAHGGDGDDKIYGEYGADTLYGDANDDHLYGQNGNDKLYGNEGDDELNGGNNDDILIGGPDNDFLKGGNGKDTYKFISTSSGSDTINDVYGESVISLPDTIAEDDIRAYIGDKNSILIKYGSSDITITNFFSNEDARNVYYCFGDNETKFMGKDSFAYKLYDRKYDIPLEELFGCTGSDCDSQSYVSAYKELIDKINEELDKCSGDSSYTPNISQEDVDTANSIYDDAEYVSDVYDFITDPNNKPYVEGAFSADVIQTITDNVTEQNKFFDDTKDELKNLIYAISAFLESPDGESIKYIENSAQAMQDAYNDFMAAGNAVPPDPLIIDISGDGFSFTAADEGVNFDINNDGFAEKTGWTNGDDALLVLDRDGDGSITNGSELFGDQTILADGTLASSGFVALAELDENSDSRIDSGDSVFADLRIWQDANHNGISEADELSALADSGVESISLVSTAVDNTDAESGAYFASIANVVMADGSDCNIGEFKFPSNLYDTVDLVVAEVSEEIAALPNVRSYGSVLSLHKAMALDNDGSLFERVTSFCSETDIATVDTLLEEILFELCNAAEVDPASRGRYIDARKLTVVERMLGSDFAGVNGGNPNSAAAPILIEAYEKIYSTYYNTLTAQSTIETYLRFGQLSIEEDSVSINVDSICTYLSRNYEKGADVSRVAADLGRYFRYLDESYGTTYFIDYYCSCANIADELTGIVANGVASAQFGTDGDDSLSGTANGDIIFAGDGADRLAAKLGSDILFGDNGDDVIFGYGNDDHIIGGAGNDELRGESGIDTYYFSKGCGHDYVYDINNYSIIRFLDGITPDDLIVSHTDGNDLIIGIKDTTDTICFKAFLISNKYRDYYLAFDNREMIHCMDASSPMGIIVGDETNNKISGTIESSVIFGMDGNDIINGTSGNDSLFGGNGNDTITGCAGDDLLDGGTGNDTLDGGDGNDIYIFGEGYGTDIVKDYAGENTIKFGEGISPEDVKMTHYDANSVKLYTDIIDDTLVLNYYKKGAQYQNYTLEFDDGTILSGDNNYIFKTVHGTNEADRIGAVGSDCIIYGYDGNDQLDGYAQADALFGGDGNDKICAGANDDYIDGGAGNDILAGSTGKDIYIFGNGYGTDTISESANETSVIRFTDDISLDDLKMQHYNSYSVQITADDSDDKLILENFKREEAYRNYIMEFADGTIIDAEDNPVFKTVHGTNEADRIGAVGSDCIIYGYDGDDQLNGYDQADTLFGGDGNDGIYAGANDDYIDGGTGDDILAGGAGNDIYVYSKGYGIDTITDDAGENTIIFTDIISPDDLKMYHYDSYSVKLTVDGSNNMIILKNYKNSDKYKNFTMEFADGTVIEPENNDIFKIIHGTDETDSISSINEDSVLYGYAGDDIMYGVGYSDTFYGGDGSDRIYGKDGDDLFFGEAGDDYMQGNNGIDMFDSGSGNDEMDGGDGNDIYIFCKGYGTDTINDNVGENIIRFTDDISLNDLKMYHYNSSSVKIIIDGADDILILKNYKSSDSYKNYSMEFADGTVVTAEENPVFKIVHGTDEADSISSINADSILYGYAGDDTLYGVAYSDTIYGGDGSDRIYGKDGDDLFFGEAGDDYMQGNNGNDVFDSGSGSDEMDGGDGNDIYIFGKGYGADTINDNAGENIIRFIGDISPDDLKMYHYDPGSVKLVIDGADDVLILKNYKRNDSYKNYTMEFADGTVITAEDNPVFKMIHGTDNADNIAVINEGSIMYGHGGNDQLYGNTSSDTIYGGEGNDYIVSHAGDDIIDGGAGNDSLNGNGGHDTYVFGIGYGTDTITEVSGDTGTISFTDGITAADLTLSCSYNVLSISVNETDDVLKINQFGASEAYQGYILEFEDGSTYTIDPSAYTLIPTSDADTETVDYSEAADTITEMQTYDAACVAATSNNCVIYPNIALINDILAVAENDIYNNVSDNKINFTDKSDLLFEQFYVN